MALKLRRKLLNCVVFIIIPFYIPEDGQNPILVGNLKYCFSQKKINCLRFLRYLYFFANQYSTPTYRVTVDLKNID